MPFLWIAIALSSRLASFYGIHVIWTRKSLAPAWVYIYREFHMNSRNVCAERLEKFALNLNGIICIDIIWKVEWIRVRFRCLYSWGLREEEEMWCHGKFMTSLKSWLSQHRRTLLSWTSYLISHVDTWAHLYLWFCASCYRISITKSCMNSEKFSRLKSSGCEWISLKIKTENYSISDSTAQFSIVSAWWSSHVSIRLIALWGRLCQIEFKSI